MEKWEDKLPPRARERLAQIKITPEDRERIKAQEKVKFLLSEFYQDKIQPEEFVERLKNEKKERREFLARESQQKLIDSLSLQISSPDFKKRGRCILLLERLKEKGKDNQVKAEINLLGSLIKKYLEEKERVYQHLKKQVEENPRLRIRQAKTERGEDVIVQLSPDEAVLTLSEWKDFVSQHEGFYRSEFDRSIGRLRRLI